MGIWIQSPFSENHMKISMKIGLLPSKNTCVISFIESPLKTMKNAFYFILKAFSILKIFSFRLDFLIM